MSLTSYRAAPPRASVGLDRRRSRQRAQTQTAALETRHRGVIVEDVKRRVVLGRSGDDLLSRVLRHSTIGAEEFNGRVRDGIGFFAPRSNHRTSEGQTGKGGRASTRNFAAPRSKSYLITRNALGPQGPQARTGVGANAPGLSFQSSSRTWIMRAIKPIERLVPVSSTRHRAYTPGLSTWSSSTALIGSTRFEVGFPLRCLQRLSRPYIAMLHCGWRHNSSTRGTSIPVLSY